MAVAFDAVGPSAAGFFSGTTLVSSGSWKHTCTGTNLLLIVDVGIGNNPDTGLGVTVSYGGQSMTQVGSNLHSGGITRGFMARFKLVNPPAGTNTVSVSVTGGKAVIVGGSMSFNGADQSTGIAATTYTATGNSTTATVSVASNTSGNIIASSAVSGHSNRPIGSGGTRTFAVNGTLQYYASNEQGGTWAATGSPVTTSFTFAAATAGDEWAIISSEVLSASAGVVVLPAANLQLAAQPIAVNPADNPQWFSQYNRAPLISFAGAPSLTPLQIPVSNTAGQWMFAVISWRQDAGTTGALQYPSTVNVSDDAGNFWIPVQPGQHATGIVRCAVWMAPAARAATQVTISPASTVAGDAYQSALMALIFEYPGACPWYSVEETEFGYVNQGSTLTVTQANTTTGLFSVGVVATDNNQMPVTVTAGGWSSLITYATTNFSDDTGDLQQFPFLATTAGSPLSLTIARSSGNNVADLAGVIITLHGVTDAIAFPYTVPDVENWPVLVTEIGAGPVLNANPVMLKGTTDWSVAEAGGGALTAATWPVYQPYPNYQSLITPSIAMTPSGTVSTCTLVSELEPVNAALRYNTLASVYSPAGYEAVAAQVNWYDNTSAPISVTTAPSVAVQPGTWTQLSWASATSASTGIYPPGNAAYGAGAVVMTAVSTTDVPSAPLYIGYCALGVADAYENIPLDDIAWTDVSSRNFTQGPIQVSRGIQYEQQSLEAGTATIYLRNDDGAMMFGNLLSSYWPNIGDTDVPIRLRAVWPQSTTPYYQLFTGFTDQITFQWDEEDLYGFAEVEASDGWSRMTTQMLDAGLQEILEDQPAVLCPCSNSGASIALASGGPVVSQVSAYGAGSVTASFGSSAITLPGMPSQSCWQSQGNGGTVSSAANQGYALTYFPALTTPLPAVSGGITTAFWMNTTAGYSGQPPSYLTVCTAYSGAGPAWSLFIDNTGLAGNTFLKLATYDQGTGAGTTTQVAPEAFLFFGGGFTGSAGSYYISVAFTQVTLTVTVQSPAFIFPAVLTVPVNLAPGIVGFSLGGNAGPLFALNGNNTAGFWNAAFADFTVFQGLIPASRLTAQFGTAASAWPGEADVARLARVQGYAGATPVILQSRGWDLGIDNIFAAPGAELADLDTVTAVTDTNGQVTSSYFTNIASSTLAFMFVNGSGILVYRRRLQQYNRAIGQWAIGDAAAVPLNSNTLSESASTSPWFAENGATLTSAGLAAAGPEFYPFAGLFHGDGSTANPAVAYGAFGFSNGVPVTPGLTYTFSAAICSPQGWATGAELSMAYFTAALGFVSSQASPTMPLSAGSPLWLTTGSFRAPATAAYAWLTVAAIGTPASNVQFYVAGAACSVVPPVTAGGAGATTPEVPEIVSPKLSSDRALMYNQAVLTQYGTSTETLNQGSSIVFQPTSGVLVTIQNNASVLARAGVPYTATTYQYNTVQALPYYLNEPSIEDLGNWITQTLAVPLLRTDTVRITPAATPQAMQMALQAEVADTTTYRRRQPGAPEIQILTYISKLSHAIDISTGQWDVAYELSPFQAGSVLQADDVIHGTLTGGNLLAY